MKTFFRLVLLAPLLGGLAGCCANSANTCDDIYADSLFVVLKDAPDNANDTSYFTKEELDTVYLQRYAPAVAANPTATPATKAQPAGALSDPVTIVRAQQTRASLNSRLALRLASATPALLPTTIVISNNTPFPTSATGGKLSAYNYVLTVYDRSVKNTTRYVDTLKNIQLQGRYTADGCTTCYENTLKTLVRRGKNARTVLNVTEGQNGRTGPVPVLITKLD
jgi:hypothetical protein